MKHDLMAVDVALIRFARTCVAGTIAQRKARRDAVQALMDQSDETVKSAGIELLEGGAFKVAQGGMPRALLTVDLELPTVATLTEMVEEAVWPAQIAGEIEDVAIALRDTLQGWMADAQAEAVFAQLSPEAQQRVLAQRTGEE